MAPVLKARVTALEVVVDSSKRTTVVARQVAGAACVMIAGLEPKEAAIRVKVSGLSSAVGVAIAEDRPVLIRDGVIEDTLPVWGVRLHKIVPQPKRAG